MREIKEVDKLIGRELEKEWERWLWLFWRFSGEGVIRVGVILRNLGMEKQEWWKGLKCAYRLYRWGYLGKVGRGEYVFNRKGLKKIEELFGKEELKFLKGGNYEQRQT